MIYVILGRFTKETAARYAAHPEDPNKKKAAELEQEVRTVIADSRINGRFGSVVWTLGEYDLVITFEVASAEGGAAAALALANRLGIGTTTLTGFTVTDLQKVMDDGGHAAGHAGY